MSKLSRWWTKMIPIKARRWYYCTALFCVTHDQVLRIAPLISRRSSFSGSFHFLEEDKNHVKFPVQTKWVDVLLRRKVRNRFNHGKISIRHGKCLSRAQDYGVIKAEIPPTSSMAVPIWAGESTTLTPASRSAKIFALAPPANRKQNIAKNQACRK